MHNMRGGQRSVDVVIDAMVERMRANVSSMAKALSGRITWRWTKNGTVEITIQPDL